MGARRRSNTKTILDLEDVIAPLQMATLKQILSTLSRHFVVCLSVSLCISICLSVCLLFCLPVCLPICLPVCLPVCLSVFPRLSSVCVDLEGMEFSATTNSSLNVLVLLRVYPPVNPFRFSFAFNGPVRGLARLASTQNH